MTPWLILAVGAQFINAIVALVDKYIVTSDKGLPRPFVYAFLTCLLSGSAILAYLFNWVPVPLEGVHFPDIRNVEFPTLTVIAFSFLAAYTFFSGIVSLFSALRAADASDVVPVVGGISALSTFALAYLFLDARLSPNFFFGVILLSLGTFLVSQMRFRWQVALLSLHAGVFFGLHYVIFKGLLDITSFDNGFFWSRIGFVALAVSLLMVPEWYEKIRDQLAHTSGRGGVIVLLNKILAGTASLMILKATELGDTAVVQALGGLQFVFVLALGFVFGGWLIPRACGEDCRKWRVGDIVRKTIYVSIITFGFFALFV